MKLIIVLLTVSGISSGAAFWLFKPPLNNDVPETIDNNWQLPEFSISSKEIQNLYLKLQQLKPWGADATVTAAAPTEMTAEEREVAARKLLAAQVKLQLVGIVRKRRGSYALFLNEDTKKTTAYFLNQTLPNGLDLVAIQTDSVTVKSAEQEMKVIPLYETQ